MFFVLRRKERKIFVLELKNNKYRVQYILSYKSKFRFFILRESVLRLIWKKLYRTGYDKLCPLEVRMCQSASTYVFLYTWNESVVITFAKFMND